MTFDSRVGFRKNLLAKVKTATKVICVSLIILMYMVTFSSIVNKYMSEVGEPTDGLTFNDWVIEPGDVVVRENEAIKMYGDIIVQPGGNLSLINCMVQFFYPLSGSYKVEVQCNEEGTLFGELFLQGTTMTVINESGGYYFDFVIEGNSTIDGCDLSYMGSSADRGGIQVYSDNVSILNSKIHDNEKFGIYTESNPVIINNEIYSNTFGIYFYDSTSKGAIIKDNSGSNQFGSYVSCMWDFNNDTYSDIVVSAPYDDSMGADAGAVYVFYGTPTISISELIPSDANIKLFGESSGDLFGTQIDFDGDLNGDGSSDLVVTAPGSNKVYAFFTNSSGYGGLIVNSTVSQFESGSSSNIEISSGNGFGDGSLTLQGNPYYLTWDLENSNQRSYTSDLDFWSDGLSISFPDDNYDYTISGINDYGTGYFTYDETLDDEIDGDISYSSNYYDNFQESPVSGSYVTGIVDEAVDFDGYDDFLMIEADDPPFGDGNGTIQFWMNAHDDSTDERSLLDTEYRKMVFGKYEDNLTRPQFGIVAQDNRLHVETYTNDGTYDEHRELDSQTIQNTAYFNPINLPENLVSYNGLVNGPQDLTPMTGPQGLVYFSAPFSIRGDGNSWQELLTSQYYMNTTAQLIFRARCDNMGEIHAIGVANGSGPGRQELLYRLGGTTPWGQGEMAQGNWVNNNNMVADSTWYQFTLNLYNDWYNYVSATDFMFDRIIIVTDVDTGTGVQFFDDLQVSNLYTYVPCYSTYDFFNGSIVTNRILTSDMYLYPNQDYNVKFYEKNHFGYLEIDGTVQDIQLLNSSVESKLELNPASDFYAIAQRPMKSLVTANPPEEEYDQYDSHTTFSSYSGWIDELKFYNVPIEETPIDPREGDFYPYQPDIYTELLLHFESDQNNDIENDHYYNVYDFDLEGHTIVRSNDGYFGKCVEFNGNTYINGGNWYNLSQGTFETYFSLASDFSSASGSDLYILHKDGAGAGYIKLYFEESNGKLTFSLKEDTNENIITSTSTSWDGDKWYHVAVTWGDGMKMYINGILQESTDDFSGFCGNDDSKFLIGCNFQTSQYVNKFLGKLDEVRLSTIPRSDFPTLDYFWSGYENLGTDTVFLAHLNEGSGSDTVDTTNNNQGTLSSCTWVDGYFGRCLQFSESSSSEVTFPTNGGDYDIDTEISIDAWVYPTSFDTTYSYIAQRSTAYGLLFYKSGSNVYLRGTVTQSSQQYSPTTNNLYNFKNGEDRWYHVGMTYDTSTAKIRTYVNGLLNSEGTLSNPVNIPETGSYIEIGDGFTGKIDDVRISPNTDDNFYSKVKFDNDILFKFDFTEGTGLSSLDEDHPTNKAVLFDGDDYGGSWVSGVNDFGIDLDGSDDYIWINDSKYDYNPLDLSLSIFIKLQQTLTEDKYVIVNKENSFNLTLEKDGSDYHLVATAIKGAQSYSTSVPDEAIDINDLVGYWTRISLTFSEGNLTTFVNGRYYGRATVPYLTFSNLTTMTVGKDSCGNYFDGVIDQFYVNNVNSVNNVRYRAEVISTVKNFDSPVLIENITIPSNVHDGTSVKYQVRYGNTSSEATSASFVGPSGSSSYYHVGDIEFEDISLVAKYVQVRILIESDIYGITPFIHSINITGVGYHDEGSYQSSVCEIPDWVDKVYPDIDYVTNGRSVSFKLAYSDDGSSWTNYTMHDNTLIDLTGYSSKYLKYYVDIPSHNGVNGAFTPVIKSIKLWYQFEAGIGSFELSGSSRFGEVIDSGGDFNGDGYADIAIGSPGEKKVYIYHGGPTMDSNVDCTITSTDTNFGYHLTHVTDYNTDGCDELSVVSNAQAKVFIYSGSDLSGSISSSSFEDVITGSGSFGSNIFLMGDVDGDTFDDIGVYSYSRYFYVYSGKDLFENGNLTLADYLFMVDGGSGSDLGNCAQGQFDFDSDNFGDLLLVDSSSDTVYVFRGSDSISGTVSTSDSIYTFVDEESSSTFGEVSSVGDINGDHFIDFVLGDRLRSTDEGTGAVHSLGPSSGRVANNDYYNNQYGVYLKDSQQSINGDHFFDNRYAVYSDHSTTTLISVQVQNSTSGFDHGSDKGIYVDDGFMSIHSSNIYTHDNEGLTNLGGIVSLFDVNIDQSVSEYIVDYSMDSLEGSYENIELDGGSVRLVESGTDQIFVENWSVIDEEKWNSSGSGDAVEVNNTWSGSGDDVKVFCNGDDQDNADLNLKYTIEFDDKVSARDYTLDTKFLLLGTKSNFTTGSRSRVVVTFYKSAGGSQTRKMVISGYDQDLIGTDPLSSGWTNYGDSWMKNTSATGIETYYLVSNGSSYEFNFQNERLIDIICDMFNENPENWPEIKNLTIEMIVKEMTVSNSSGEGYDPTIYCDKIEVTNPLYTPVYYGSGYLVSDLITKPTNNGWNELFVRYQDPNDIDTLEISILDSSNNPLVQVTTLPYDLSGLNAYAQLKFKAEFQGNTLSTSTITKWGISFKNLNDTAVVSEGGEFLLNSCSISNLNSMDISMSQGAKVKVINTHFEDNKVSISDANTELKRYSKLDVDTYPEIHPYMDDGFNHNKTPFVDFHILDNSDNLLFSGFTNETGSIDDILLLESVWTSSGISFKSPYTFNTYDPRKAMEFDDSTYDYVALTRYFSAQETIPEMTACAWFKTSVSGEQKDDNWAFLDFDRSEYFNVYIRGDNGKMGFSTYSPSGGIQDLFGSTAYNDGEWHFVCAVYDGDNKIIYVDGVEDARINNPYSGANLGKTNVVRYGFMGVGSEAATFNANKNGYYYDGCLDNVGLYLRTLSQSDMDDFRTGNFPTNPDLLYTFEDLDWSSGSYDVKDESGNNYHGQIFNNPSYFELLTGKPDYGQLNNFQFSVGISKDLWVKGDSTDSDDDFILDSIENQDNVIWYEGEEFITNQSRISYSWSACGEASLLPDEDGVFMDRYLPIPEGDDDYVQLGIRLGQTSEDTGNSVKLSVWEVDGYSASFLLENETYLVSNNFRYYMTPIMEIDSSSDHLKVKVVSDSDQVLLDSVVIIRSSEDLGGQVTNPIMMDSDKDLVIDGVEQRSGTKWFEAEFYGDGDVYNSFEASSGKGVFNETGYGEISSVPVYLEGGKEYRYYFRGRSVQDSDWELVDDFSNAYASDDLWDRIGSLDEDDGSFTFDSANNLLYYRIHMDSQSTDIGRDVLYTNREFRINSTIKIQYNVSSDITLGRDCRFVMGVVDGDDISMRNEFALGFST